MRNWKGRNHYVYGCDLSWWKIRIGDIMDADIDAELWTLDKEAAKKYNLHWINSESRNNLSEHGSGYIHQGQNSGYQAINLAYEWGATTILLLGYDMTASKGKHWFGEHPKGLQRHSPFKGFIEHYDRIDMPDLEIINCSRDTVLTCFPRMTIDEALNATC